MSACTALGTVLARENGNSPAAASRAPLWAEYNLLRGDGYPLDVVDRSPLTKQRRLQCDTQQLVNYRGEGVSYGGVLRVHPAFAERLRRFEQIVREAGLEVYGRAPTRVRHFGAFACRTTSSGAERLSEHALGNALDVAGFDFGPAPKSERSKLPAAQRWGFRVSVEQHFSSTDAAHALQRRFLRRVIERLAEQEVFRVALGPNHRGHANHFHFDMGPWSYWHV